MKSKKSIEYDEKLYWAAFYYLGINGEKNLRRLIKEFGNLQEAWRCICNQKTCKDGASVSLRLAEKIKEFSLEKLESDLDKNKINIITLDSPKYPRKLRRITNPPLVLYCKCCRDALQRVSTKKPILSVVGTRRETVYGRRTLNYILPDIVKRDITIVSGLARGVDIHAHEITLKYGGNTVAVLAGGLDKIYPSEHRNFAEEIVNAKGMLISEHPPGTSYLRQYFPARNRIISGISDVTLVIEAGIKSGALVTADFALSQRRKVLAVPGDIFSKQSSGVNKLFEKGALPVQGPEDLLKCLFGRKHKYVIHAETGNTPHLPNTEEKNILKHIPFDRPAPLNNVIRNSNLPAATVISIISQLEIKNLIESVGGGTSYIKIA